MAPNRLPYHSSVLSMYGHVDDVNCHIHLDVLWLTGDIREAQVWPNEEGVRAVSAV